MQTLWEQRYAQRTQRMGGSAIREILKLTEQPDIISFAGGLPANDAFPVDALAEAAERVLCDDAARALQYSTTEGYAPLRAMIARHTARYGLHVLPDHILITSGSQQALDLLGKVFVNPGDRILVESPTYLGALQAWNAYGAEYIAVPTDAEGMRMDALEAALRAGPKFIYVLPNFQNPTGVTLSQARRERLIALADEHGVPLVEDDPYGQLRYEGEHLPSLVALDGRAGGRGEMYDHGNVIYLSTFSKILAPGLRVAWVVAPPEVIRKLAQAKQGADLHTSIFNQMLVHETARGGFLDRHVRLLREVYRARRDVMLAAMEQHFPAEVQWTRPQGGLFIWVTLPQGMDAAALLKIAIAQKVAFIPGASFHPQGGGAHTLRLNFTNATPENIRVGIARLGRVLHAALERPSTPAPLQFAEVV